MSAIVGIVHFNKQPVNIEHGRNLMQSLESFPADDVQVWCKDNVFLGCHAQWITPESIGEKLPFYDYERQCVITSDAIIDNRDELFERLQVEKSHRKTISDSQLILKSYYKWGEDSPKYLVGDFAFVICDNNKKQVFGARDFAGARTLYYFSDQQKLAFSTTIQPLFSLPYIKKELNQQWLAEYLAIPDLFDSVDTTSTVYKNIKQIPPSHTLLIKGDKVTLRNFAAVTMGKSLQLKSNEEYEEAFRDVFQLSVNAKLRTHKQIGSHLSGGLDSSSVVSYAVNTLRKENKHLHTYSYIPPNDFVDFTPKYRIADERPFIQSTVRHVGNINDNYLDFEGKSPLSELDDWLEIMEMPYKFLENSFWMKGVLEKAHSQGVGVLLSGGGGNFTISWGPALEYYALLLKKFRWMRLYHEANLYCKNTGARKSKIISAIGKTAFPSVYQMLSSNEIFPFPLTINHEFAREANVFEKLKEQGIDVTGSSITNPYNERKKWFENGYYWNASGTALSKLSLRYSLWSRDPTNDIRVINYCLSVPENQFVQDGYNRSLIRRSTKGYLPDKVRLNQRFRGIQGADWVYRMIPSWYSLMDEFHQLTRDPIVSEFLNIGLIKSLVSKFESEPRSDYAFNPEFRVLMRSLIVYRFLKKLT
ncbi:asparagine synthetase B [Bacillus sp. AFS073361]|uniref:lasso peptide isopeptide bond-forming cyclase n=1 Tax=Bacillus sp. AFS073361 TaxID=2033511 RepID=UPI000BF8DB86|nr:lasso peptide isopeptide bond-forming cyclase [Bacillus sp. AFS073361]PFP29480.1 asparagine synthetase B [Bacillus sp. AFS073361]